MSASPAPVRFEGSDRIGVITLDRPHARNAVDREVAVALEAAVDRLEADPGLRVGVLAANVEGQRRPVFCAGADLKVMRQTGTAATLDTDRGVRSPRRHRSRCAPAGSSRATAADVDDDALRRRSRAALDDLLASDGEYGRGR
jgi:enoyl-CoA hydratase/carnithine racemase